MPWFFLFLAGFFEMGWPLGLKVAQVTSHKIVGIVVALVSIGFSGLFLLIAQKNIPMGTAYAIWTGIGMTGTFFIGIMFFQEICTPVRLCSAFLILLGIVGLRIAA